MQATTASVSESREGPRQEGEDADYQALLVRVRHTFMAPDSIGPLFTTDAGPLFDVFLDELPADRRQHYECRSCRRFVDGFGDLVAIDAEGTARSPFWDLGWPAGSFFDRPVRALSRLVGRAKVTGVFLSPELRWGLDYNVSQSPKTRGITWHHMHVVPSTGMVHRPGALKTSFAVMAEKREEYGMLQRGLAEFSIDTARQALALLQSEGLFRSDKHIAVAEWFFKLHETREATKNQRARENLVWRAVASAPPGFCHVRTTILGTLLEDIQGGKDFNAIKRAFDEKMDPLKYRRPTAAPTEGQLANAEKVVAALASAGALERRFATIAEVRPFAIWTPAPTKVESAKGGVFGHLAPKKPGPPSLAVPAQTMTWSKFLGTVLPKAERVELLVPQRASFFAFCTAVDPAAPPILQWDSPEKRNPFSWYVYGAQRGMQQGSRGDEWGLIPGTWCDVVAITRQPAAWTSEHFAHYEGAYLLLRGARDVDYNRKGAGLALFPEILRSEYHGIRAALEALSGSKRLQGQEESDLAAGLTLQKGGGFWDQTLRVTTTGAHASYRLDRFD